MPTTISRLLRTAVCAAALCVPIAEAVAQGVPGGQNEPTAAALAAAASAPSPEPGDTNARRAITQPGNNAPFWRAVRDSGKQPGTVNLPGAEKGVLVQPYVQYPGSRITNAGEAWRQARNRWIIPYGGALLLIVVVALALYYFAKGPMGGHVPYTGRKIERFTYFERATHWVNAIAFCALAISGIVIAFGKFWLLPLIGVSLFGWLTYALKTLHNFVGPLFVVSLAFMILTFVRDNFPNASDWQWLKRGGGMFGGAEPPSGRFNAGEKIVFWGGVFVLGIVVVASGLVLDKLIPGLDYLRTDMQIAQMVHGIATALMMAMFLGHIYLGTLGMKDAYPAMKTGYVDEGWAKEHHALWLEDIRAGRVPAQRSSRSLPPVADRPAAQL